MAIQQTKRQSDLEKRLQLLRRQVYGKGSENSSEEFRNTQRARESEDQKIRKSENSDTLILRHSDLSGTPSRSVPTESGYSFSGSESFRTDLVYLQHDLLKILIFASFAIGAQIILFILSKNHILNLNFL